MNTINKMLFKAVNKSTKEEHHVSSICMDKEGNITGFWIVKGKSIGSKYQSIDGNYDLIKII